MANYYILKIDSGIDTFSQFEAGINFKFGTNSLKSEFSFENGDKILGYKPPSSYYVLNVQNYQSNELNLIKQIEVDSHFRIKVEKSGPIYKIDEESYNNILNDILSVYKSKTQNDNSIVSENLVSTNLKTDFANWFVKISGSKHNYYRDSFGSNLTRMIEGLSEYEKVYKNDFGSDLFELPIDYNFKNIESIKNNLYSDSGLFFDFSKNKSHHMPRAILGNNNYLKFLKMRLINSANLNSPTEKPINKIYFGAPGTGKSYKISDDLKNVDLIFQKRVTFHPEFDNFSFIGGFKPLSENGQIKYGFIPQVFAKIYVEACNDPEHQYYLIIEEINRGNCAEIFGEIFQLLDRDSKYKITPSSEFLSYLNENITDSKYFQNNQMLLPDNLSVLATMNTSDQSLFPMDSAFKRRWDWEYIPINYDKNDLSNDARKYKIKVNEELEVNWLDFIDKVNHKIQYNRNLGMDKCIGNYFIKPDLNDLISLDIFIFKVIFYLWNDVFKDEPNDSIFRDNLTYQDFFPISLNGEKHVVSILKDLKLI